MSSSQLAAAAKAGGRVTLDKGLLTCGVCPLVVLPAPPVTPGEAQLFPKLGTGQGH